MGSEANDFVLHGGASSAPRMGGPPNQEALGVMGGSQKMYHLLASTSAPSLSSTTGRGGSTSSRIDSLMFLPRDQHLYFSSDESLDDPFFHATLDEVESSSSFDQSEDSASSLNLTNHSSHSSSSFHSQSNVLIRSGSTNSLLQSSSQHYSNNSQSIIRSNSNSNNHNHSSTSTSSLSSSHSSFPHRHLSNSHSSLSSSYSQQRGSSSSSSPSIGSGLSTSPPSFHMKKQQPLPLSPPQLVRTLTSWYFQWVEPGVNNAICLQGFDPQQKVFWSTSQIVKRVSQSRVCSASGTVYQLMGTLNCRAMASLSFHKTVIRKFRAGFPEDWKQVLSEWAGLCHTYLEPFNELCDDEDSDNFCHDPDLDPDRCYSDSTTFASSEYGFSTTTSSLSSTPSSLTSSSSSSSSSIHNSSLSHSAPPTLLTSSTTHNTSTTNPEKVVESSQRTRNSKRKEKSSSSSSSSSLSLSSSSSSSSNLSMSDGKSRVNLLRSKSIGDDLFLHSSSSSSKPDIPSKDGKSSSSSKGSRRGSIHRQSPFPLFTASDKLISPSSLSSASAESLNSDILLNGTGGYLEQPLTPAVVRPALHKPHPSLLELKGSSSSSSDSSLLDPKTSFSPKRSRSEQSGGSSIDSKKGEGRVRRARQGVVGPCASSGCQRIANQRCSILYCRQCCISLGNKCEEHSSHAHHEGNDSPQRQVCAPPCSNKLNKKCPYKLCRDCCSKKEKPCRVHSP